MDDDLYNLMKAMVKRAQAIFGYTVCLQDAAKCDCPECASLWTNLRAQDQKALKEMKAVFQMHFHKFKED